MSASRTLTLADAALPRAGWVSDAALVFSAALLTALASQIAVPLPWTPVPLTGQTFAVLLSGIVLGGGRGFLSQVLYLAAGASGLPVFAGGAAGVMTFLGPTGGYLLAFPLAAAVTGALAERGWDRRFVSAVAAMLLGSSVIFACGLAMLSRFVPTPALLASGLLPFLPGDVLKAAFAALALPLAWRATRRP